MRRIQNHKLAAGLVISVLAAVVCATPIVRSSIASGPGLKPGAAASLANRTTRALAPTPMGPETTPFNGTYSDVPNPQACGPRHKFTIPAGKTRIVAVATADVPSNDIVLNLYGPSGDRLNSNDTGTSPESATYEAPGGIPAGTYEVEVCPFDDPSAPATAPYTYRGTFTTDDTVIPNPVSTPTPGPIGTPTPGPPVIPPRYHEYQPPAAIGENAGEPTLGFNMVTKRVMYIAGLQTLRVTFPESREPLNSIPEAGPALWEDVSFIGTSKKSLDPIIFTDQRTNRTFVSQLNSVVPPASPVLIGLNSLMAYTDDDGATWTPAQLNPPDGSYDHQTVGGGPYPALLSALSNPLNKGSAVYYCAQAGVTAFCSRSDDGGLNFGRSTPVYQAVSAGPVTGCGGIHGHVKVAPDGTVYLPNRGCNGKQGMAVSTDGGTTWTVRQIPGSMPPSGILDPSIGIASDGTVYFSFTGPVPGGAPTDNHIFVAVSRDRGATWSTPVDLGTTHGIKNAVFSSAVAGDPNRAAVVFIGTTTGGNHEDANFKGVWYGYAAHTYDGGASWTTVLASPNGPVQREACIWNQGGSNPCRNLLDFNDVEIDDKGRVLFSFADGCIDGCETGGPNSYSAKATISRQSGGKGLLAQYDTPEPALPKRPYLTGSRDDLAAYLKWAPPDNGGSAITGYKIYRTGGTDVNKFIGQTTGDDNDFSDRGGDISVSKYTYSVKAVNALGESAASNAVELTVGPRVELTGACQLPGNTIISDPVGDASDTLEQHDITSVSVAEPDSLAGKVAITIKVKNLSTVPAGWRWSVRFLAPGYGPPAATGIGAQEDWFVSMTTSDGPTPAFTFGTTGVNPNIPARLFTTLGNLDAASSVTSDGVITMVLSKEAFRSRAVCSGSCGPLNPGQPLNLTLGSVRASGPSALPSAGGTNETIPDTTGAGTYVLRTPTLCLPNTAPLAMITANVSSGEKPLTVNFDGNLSRDSDAIDTIASYTFNFGDGSDDVTQTSPLISHTYHDAGEYITRLVVTDSRGKVSSNTAMFKVDVEEPVQCPTNVARATAGAGASASSTYNAGYAASSVIDGERKGLNWGNLGGWNDATRGTYPDWVDIQFNGAQKLTEIRVFTVQNDFQNPVEPDINTPATVYGILDFEVQYWDGSQWVTVPNGAVTGNDKAMRVFQFPEITTTKIRVLVTNARNNFSRLTEVEAIGCPAAP
ncbi:MAG TPA: PKD domain-containing protein [Pyrinomonadaceae bacterium]